MKLPQGVYRYFIRRRRGEGFLRLLDEFEANQWKSPQEIEQIQWNALQVLLEHAEREVPYYQQLFQRLGIRAAEIRSLQDFTAMVPPLTKVELREHERALIRRGADPAKLQRNASSGSTGIPTAVYFDPQRIARAAAFNTRFNRWAGWEWGARVARVWGIRPAAGAAEKRPSPARQLHGKLRNFLVGNPEPLRLNAYYYTQEELLRFVRRLARFRPEVLIGYANSVRDVAQCIQENGIRVVGLKCIVTGAEVLTPETRSLLERVLDAPVFNLYGSLETGVLACECERHRLHLNADNLIVEVVPDPGEAMGRIVVTDLFNYAMPLLRYDLEDMGVMSAEACPCGRGLPVLEHIEGRRSEIFPTASGARVDGYAFNPYLRSIPAIRNYQVRQKSLKLISIQVVADTTEPLESLLKPVLDAARGWFGEDCEFELIKVDHIPKVGTGKYRYLISDLN